jgi:hypothetical protein
MSAEAAMPKLDTVEVTVVVVTEALKLVEITESVIVVTMVYPSSGISRSAGTMDLLPWER